MRTSHWVGTMTCAESKRHRKGHYRAIGCDVVRWAALRLAGILALCCAATASISGLLAFCSRLPFSSAAVTECNPAQHWSASLMTL